MNTRLSLQYGLRYDALPHVWERSDAISNFVPSTYQPALAPAFDPTTGAFMTSSPGLQTVNGTQFYLNGIQIAGQNGTPRGIVKNWFQTYQPRVGFSYDVTGSGKTVLRGGFGTFFEREQGNDIYDIAGGAPFENTPSANNVELSNPSYNWASGGAASTPLFPQGPNSESTYYPAPGVAQYSLGVQHELAPALILVTQYVGNLAWHQNTFLPINNDPLSTPLATREAQANGSLTACSTCAALGELARTYPGFGGMSQITNLLTGSYNSFQIGVRQQNKHGLSFEVDYTYAHEIDDQVGSNDLNTSSNPWNLKYDKGSGSLDRRNIVNANYTYKIPVFAHSAGLTHSILGGWELSGTVISESGLPWAGNNTPGSGYSDTVGLGGGYTNRPNITGKPNYVKSKTAAGYQWVTANFSQPQAAWAGGSNLGFGNEGRDAILGPGRTNFTTSVYKSFAFTERARFEMRADSFNTFNHTQFSAFNNTASSGNFGITTNTQDPREFEFGGKIIF